MLKNRFPRVISIKEHILDMRTQIRREIFEYSLEEEEIPNDFERSQKLDKILPPTTAQRGNYPYQQLKRKNEEKLLEEHNIDTMKIKKLTYYVKKFDEMPSDPELKVYFETVRNSIKTVFREMEEEQVTFKSLLETITLKHNEISVEQMTYLVKILIELEEIDGSKISHFKY